MELLVVVLLLGTGLVCQSTPALSASVSVSGLVTPTETGNSLSSHKLVDSNSDLGDSSEDGQYYDDDAAVTFVTDEDVLYKENSSTLSPSISSSNYYSGNINSHLNSNPFAEAHSIPTQFQGNSNLPQAVPANEWSDGRCPPFPEIPTSSQSHRELCESRRRCSRDSDCISSSGLVSGSGSGASLICCYNGCIHSCQHKIDPPLAFDWLEETELMTWRNATDLDEDTTSAPVTTTTSRTARSKSPFSTNKEPRGGQKTRKKTLLGAGVGRETIALPGGCFLNSDQYEHLRQFRKHQHVDSCMCSEGDVVCQVNVEKDRLPSSTQISGLVQKITSA